MQELDLLEDLSIKNIAFYDDSLLFKTEQILEPFLDAIEKSQHEFDGFHTPNALNARFLNESIADRMAGSGFKTFYIGYESGADNWQKTTGGKVYSFEFEKAVGNLLKAGVPQTQITCYLIVGHPRGELQQIEESMCFANHLGIKIMLSEFSPIPGTLDGELCRGWVDLDEPLNHNKVSFTRKILGDKRTQELKDMATDLNRSLTKEN
jgi:radical SAM superfamily enzyme YgiQ (UPF0313 family)